jgi:hypothetical protein
MESNKNIVVVLAISCQITATTSSCTYVGSIRVPVDGDMEVVAWPERILLAELVHFGGKEKKKKNQE